MKFSRVLWAAVILAVGTPWAPAAEPYRQFVERLRERHPDLAVAYLQKLQAAPPADLDFPVALELAKTRVEQARQEGDSRKRAALYQAAQTAFEEYLAAKPAPAPAQVVEANQQLAHLITLQGKEQLSKARRQETKEAETTERDAARALFDDAGKRIEAVITQLDEQIKALGTPADPKGEAALAALVDARAQAEIDQATSLIDRSATYNTDDPNNVALRGKDIERAVGIFEAITKGSDDEKAKLSRKNPLWWVARAWLAKCKYELDDNTAARKEFENILKAYNALPPRDAESRRVADQGTRLAEYFWMQMVSAGRDAQVKTPPPLFVKTINDGESWLARHRDAWNTPEGYGVRYLLGTGYFEQGVQALATANPKAKPSAQQIVTAKFPFRKALALFRAIDETENDFTAKAREKKYTIILTMAEFETQGDVTALKTFEECFLRAQLELARLIREEKAVADLRGKPSLQPTDLQAKEKDLAAKRKDHFALIIKVLLHGIRLPEVLSGQATEQDVTDARSLLAYSELAIGNHYEAVVFAEDFARSEPASNRAPFAAAHALQGYVQLIWQDEQAVKKLGDEKEKEAERALLQAAVDTDRRRLRQLAEYMERVWPEEAPTDEARFQIADMLVKEKKLADALPVLERIKLGYPNIARARFMLAQTAMVLREDPKLKENEKRKTELRDLARRALEEIPTPGARHDMVTAESFAYGKLKLLELLFLAKKYDDMNAKAKSFLTTLESLELTTKEKKQEIKFALETLQQYSVYGRALDAFKEGKFDDVEKIIDPMIKDVTATMVKLREEETKRTAEVAKDEKDKLQENQERLGVLTQQIGRSATLLRGLLVLWLQLKVQENDSAKLLATLDAVKKAVDDTSLDGGIAVILVELVQEMRKKITDLKGEKGPEAQAKLTQTLISFRSFLEKLAGQKNLSPEVTMFVAYSYAGLDAHKEAAEMANRVTAPKPPKGDDEKEAYNKQLAVYHGARLLTLKQLRLAKNYDDAKKVYDELYGTEKAPGWGRNNLDVIKEHILWLEDQRILGGQNGAVQRWAGLMKQLQGRIATDSRTKEQYFDAYYHHARCLYFFSQNPKQKENKASLVSRSAAEFLRMDPEAAKGALTADLVEQMKTFLAEEPELQTAYDGMKGKEFLGGKAKPKPVEAKKPETKPAADDPKTMKPKPKPKPAAK